MVSSINGLCKKGVQMLPLSPRQSISSHMLLSHSLKLRLYWRKKRDGPFGLTGLAAGILAVIDGTLSCRKGPALTPQKRCSWCDFSIQIPPLESSTQSLLLNRNLHHWNLADGLLMILQMRPQYLSWWCSVQSIWPRKQKKFKLDFISWYYHISYPYPTKAIFLSAKIYTPGTDETINFNFHQFLIFPILKFSFPHFCISL